jgi:hypothetical protein
MNEMVREVEQRLGLRHYFTVAYAAWSVERVTAIFSLFCSKARPAVSADHPVKEMFSLVSAILQFLWGNAVELPREGDWRCIAANVSEQIKNKIIEAFAVVLLMATLDWHQLFRASRWTDILAKQDISDLSRIERVHSPLLDDCECRKKMESS